MKINIEKFEEKCELHFTATVEADEWKDAQSKATAELAKNVTVKGFRKGHAPLAQAAKYISPKDVLDKAADKAVQKAYSEMVDKNKITPAMQPELKVNEFGVDKLSFTFVVVTMPVFTLGEYKGITIEKEAIEVTDEDVNAELNNLANRNAELVVADLDYEAKLGDTVVIDFKGFVDNEAFDGGEASSYELELGTNTFVPGFEDQLVGVKTNEDRDVVLTFPHNYVANLADKEATFKVHVNAIKNKVVPEINDDLAKDADIDGVDNLEQLKEHYKTQLIDRKTKQQENSQYAKLVDKICENSTFVCHDNIVKQDAERIVKDFESRLSAQGFDVDDYLKMTGKTKDDIMNEAKVEAVKNEKHAYMYDRIAAAEGIKITPEDLENKIAEIAKQYNQSASDIKKQIGNRLNGFAFNLLQERVTEFLKTNNNI
ncbi:MAG: trigger factor [Erysipelotrichaceae bacterium]|nr:trigger factor [Erysipelotrichaceae bacterium]